MSAARGDASVEALPGTRSTRERQARSDGVWCAISPPWSTETLRATATACRVHCKHVLVLCDARTEADIGAHLDGLDVEVIRRDAGRDIRSALEHIRARGGAYVLTADGAASLDTAEVARLLDSANEPSPGLAIGTIGSPATGPGRPNGAADSISNLLVRLETGLDLPDTRSRLRCYPVGLIARVRTHGHRDTFETEILTRAAWAGVPIRPVEVRVAGPGTHAHGGSPIRSLRDRLRLPLLHARLLARQLVPWPHARLVAGQRAPREIRGLRAWVREQLREHATPGGLAASAAVGIFLGVLPLVATHVVAIVYVTSRLRLNKVMALAVQNLCMPPFLPVVCIQVGHHVLYGRLLTEISFDTIVVQSPQRLLEWLIGSLFLAPTLAALAGAATFVVARIASRRLGERAQADEPTPGV